MTLRSRLSAAWKAFIRDDFPPVLAVKSDDLIIATDGLGNRIRFKQTAGKDAGTVTVHSMADEVEKIQAEQDAKIRAELEDMHSTLTPDNAEPVKLTKRPRKKLESVKK